MRYLFLAILFNPFFQSFGQVEIKRIINVEAEQIYSDNFDNLYVLSENIIIKYNREGKETATFHPENGEEITSVDVRNPFKISLFFNSTNKIVLLDNKLTQISDDIYLDKAGIVGDALICNATIGGFWVYDNSNTKLLKLKTDFSLEYTIDLYISEDIISITDNASSVIFQTRSGALLTYDINSGDIENLSIYKASDNYRFVNKELVFYSANQHGLTFYNWNTGKYRHIILPSNIAISNAVYGKTNVFFFNKNKVYISSVNED